MPWFESQRLFYGQLELLLERLVAMLERDDDRRSHSAWLFGGSVAAAQAVTADGSDLLKQVWGKGNERSALSLMEPFTLSMISAWYAALDQQMAVPDDLRDHARIVAASNIMELFGHLAADRVTNFIKFDDQFNCDRRSGGDSGHGAMTTTCLTLSIALQACEHASRIDWNEFEPPANSLFDFIGQVGDIDSINTVELLALRLSLRAGERAMFNYYRDYHYAA